VKYEPEKNEEVKVSFEEEKKEPEVQVNVEPPKTDVHIHVEEKKNPEVHVHIEKEPEVVTKPATIEVPVANIEIKPKLHELPPQSPPRHISISPKQKEPEIVLTQDSYDGPFSINSVLPSSEGPFDQSYKVIVIGESGVGKTNLLGRWSRNQYVPASPTISVTLVEKSFKVEDKIVRIIIWDTAGQETFRSLTRSYYRGAQGAILVFDLTNAASFFNVEKWLNDHTDKYLKKKHYP
jgi:hypothetical protein